MRVPQYTAILCTALIFGCASHEVLPPAVPEPKTFFSLSLTDMDNPGTREDPCHLGFDIVTPPPSMLEVPSPAIDYIALRKRQKQRPRQRLVAQEPRPEPRTPPLTPQLVTFATNNPSPMGEMPTLPTVRRPALLDEGMPSFPRP